MERHVEIHCNDKLSSAERDAYIKWAIERYGREPVSMDIKLDGDYADVTCDFGLRPFERIRRITGYLVGTTDRWNDAKRAELRDRTNHGADDI